MKTILIIIVMLMPMVAFATPGQLNSSGCHGQTKHHCHDTDMTFIPFSGTGHTNSIDFGISNAASNVSEGIAKLILGLVGIIITTYVAMGIGSVIMGMFSAMDNSTKSKGYKDVKQMNKTVELSERDEAIISKRKKRS